MGKLGRAGRAALWSAVGALGAGAVAAVVVSQVGGAAAAASPGTDASTQAAPSPVPAAPWSGRLGPGKLWRLAIGPAGLLGGMPGAPGGPAGTPLYGDVTVNQGGVDHTYRMQTGTLSAVSGSAFTVTSSDHKAFSYTADSKTLIVKNGGKATLSSLKGAAVWVVAEQAGGRYVARSVVSGHPRGVVARVATGTLRVAAGGGSVTVGGQKFLVNRSTKVVKNGRSATLAQLNGAVVHVFAAQNQSGSWVARVIVEGARPGLPFGPPGAARPGMRWQGGSAPARPFSPVGA